MTGTNNRPDGTIFSKIWFSGLRTKSNRPLPIAGFFNDGDGKQNPPGETLVAPPKNRFSFSEPWGSLLLHQGEPKEKGGKALSFPGSRNNAIKNIGFRATIAGSEPHQILPGRQKIVKKFNFLDLPLAFFPPPPAPESSKKYNFLKTLRCALVLPPEIYKKANFFKNPPGIPLEPGVDVPHIIDGGGKGVSDISEVYYQTQRFVLHPRATVLCTNEWRHIHQVEHGLFSRVLHKVVPTQKLWKSKVSLEPFQSIKQWVLIQWIRLTLKNYEGSIGW
jgi:hypothetical protein